MNRGHINVQFAQTVNFDMKELSEKLLARHKHLWDQMNLFMGYKINTKQC